MKDDKKMTVLQKIAKYLGKEELEVKDGKLGITEEETKNLKEFFGEDYDKVMAYVQGEAKADNNEEAAKELKNAIKELPADVAEAAKTDKEEPNLVEAIKLLTEKVNTMGKGAEDASGKKIDPVKVVPINSGVSNATHLFGIEHDFFSRKKPWNEMAATRKPLEARWDKEETPFMEEFNRYAKDFAGRINELHASGQISEIKATAVDFTGFSGTGWGEAYITRRQDALIAYLRDLPTVANIFPVQYGVQDKQAMTNHFLTEFSQAYQAGEVYKGKHEVQPELAEVYDIMFKHLFSELKKLEREYIGYLNREGSQPIKWSFVEWLMAETLRKLHNEKEERRVRGYRIDPATGVAGHHLFAADGVLRRLRKYTESFQVEPFTDLKLYTSSTILAYVESMVEKVNLIVPSLRGMVLYMNEKHIPWYLAAYRTAYGKDLDFKGSMLEVKNFSIDGIQGVPNMGNSQLMWITIPGNIELYENLPGEMANFYFERRLENLIAASWWKEGTGAYMSGKKFADAATLAASGKKNQFIFVNYPVVDLLAGATTVNGQLGDVFVTINNAGATAITDITNAEEGKVYRIQCGGTTNATTIAKANKFSEISAAFIPTAVGDFLEVYYRASDAKFIEVRRKVTA